MALDPTIRAFNQLKARLGRLVVDVSVVRELGLVTGDPLISEQLEEVTGTLATMVVRVDQELEKLWRRQSPKRLRNHLLHHHKMIVRDLQ